MIWHEDFDNRNIKVICDKCEADISPQAYKEYHRRPWWRFWTFFQRSRNMRHYRASLGVWEKQWAFNTRKFRFVLMVFRNDIR